MFNRTFIQPVKEGLSNKAESKYTQHIIIPVSGTFIQTQYTDLSEYHDCVTAVVQ